MEQISNQTALEEMGNFFDRRVESYEQHMFENVDGAKLYYIETAKQLSSANGLRLLDLGCGTGLELDELFKVNPDYQVTGVDLSEKMLEKLREKHIDKGRQLHLINGSYFGVEFDENSFDAAVSVQTMHHFTHSQKVELYRKIYRWLTPGGCYIETDYVAPTQEDEDYYFAECRRIKAELGITEGFYHYDTPCTIENQIRLLKTAGFEKVNLQWRYSCTAIILAKKSERS